MTIENELPFRGALDAVREIEEAIQARDTARDVADAELETARAEAERLLREARRTGAAQGQASGQAILAAAEADAAAIRSRGVATAEQLIERTTAEGPRLRALLVPALLPRGW
jgi:hypothetical protein